MIPRTPLASPGIRLAATAVLAGAISGGRSSATWDGGRGQFPPGQLDYVLYSAATLDVRRAFVLETTDLSSRWLERYGLDVSDSERASDHRPLVVDFSWRRER